MLDGWVEDVLDCLVEINLSQGRDNLNPDDVVAATNAIFTLINSYAFRDEFPGATLCIADSDIQYAKIHLPEVNDPYSDELDIRDEAYINPLGWKFNYPEYLDIDDPEPIVWEKPLHPDYISYSTPINCTKTTAILDKLLQKNAFYSKLLEEDPDRQIENLKELDKIEYVFCENTSYHDLDRLTNMAKYSGGNIDKVFGHRYVSGSDNRHHIVAKNWLGPVGVLCLFDHASPGVLDKNPSKYSVSYVSVSPSYRRQGISTQLMREAFKQAISDERYLSRTEPSEMGEETTYYHFTELAKKEFPLLPFIEKSDENYVHALTRNDDFHEWPYKYKCLAINSFVSKIDEMIEELESKYNLDFAYNHLNLEELQVHADKIYSEYANKVEKISNDLKSYGL